MGQREILELLGKNKKKLTSKKIAELLDISGTSIMRCLATLRKDNGINYEFIPLVKDSKFCGRYIYWHK